MLNQRLSKAPPPNQRGVVLIILAALMTMGALYFLVNNLSVEFFQVHRRQATNDALNQARDALTGYAVRFRDDQAKTGTTGLAYGYLPLPDLGTSRNNNVGCTQEGCDAANREMRLFLAVYGSK